MADDVQKLLIRIEASTRSLQRDMAGVTRVSGNASKKIESQFRRSNKNVERSFSRMAANGGRSINGLSRAARAIGVALGVRELTRYADTWTKVTNQLRAASQISGLAAGSISDINDIATRSRAGLEETANLYARLLRAAGPIGKTQEEVATATELVAKAFKAGGAAASEQASGILQLGQALSSGFLQGDELRSLRENAPLVAQAIADEFKTTIGGLKKLGADGELTAGRVFDGILNGQAKFESAFSVTNSTIAEGFGLFRNSLIELVGAFNQGSKASEGITGGFASLATSISLSTLEAQRFGKQVNEAFKIIGEATDKVAPSFSKLAEAGGAFAEFSKNNFLLLIQAMKVVIATASAVGAAIGQAMLKTIDGVVTGGLAITNAGISAIEAVLNTIISGMQAVVKGINTVIAGANKLPGLDFKPIDIPLKLELERNTNPLPERFKTSVVDAFKNQFNYVKDGLDDVETQAGETYSNVARRIKNAGLIGGGRGEDPRVITDRADLATSRASGSSSVGVAKAAAAGGSSKAKESTAEKELNKLKQEGLNIVRQSYTEDEKRANKLREMQELQAQLSEALGANDPLVNGLDEAVRRFEAMSGYSKDIKDALASGLDQAIFKGGKLKDVLNDALSGLGSKAFSQFLDAAFSGTSPSGLAGALSGSFGGFRASGGPVSSNKGYIVGEDGPEFFQPRVSGDILNQKQMASRGGSGSVTLNIDASGSLDPQATAAAVQRAIAPMVDKIARGAMADNRRRA